jgi:hypothetical protein
MHTLLFIDIKGIGCILAIMRPEIRLIISLLLDQFESLISSTSHYDLKFMSEIFFAVSLYINILY